MWFTGWQPIGRAVLFSLTAYAVLIALVRVLGEADDLEDESRRLRGNRRDWVGDGQSDPPRRSFLEPRGGCIGEPRRTAVCDRVGHLAIPARARRRGRTPGAAGVSRPDATGRDAARKHPRGGYFRSGTAPWPRPT